MGAAGVIGIAARGLRRPSSLLDAARVVACSVLVESMVRRRSLAALAVWARADLPRESSAPRFDPVLNTRERRLIRLTWRWYRLLGLRGTCLRESLVAARLLSRRRCTLHVGVRYDEGVRAHAWVTVDGAAWDLSAGDYSELITADGPQPAYLRLL